MRTAGSGFRIRRLRIHNYGLDSVHRGGFPQTGDLVLEHQLATFNFGDLEVVERWMGQSFIQLYLKRLMLAFEFDQMRLHGHEEPPWVTVRTPHCVIKRDPCRRESVLPGLWKSGNSEK